MPNETVIVVDDDQSITELFSEILQLHGMRVLGTGHNGIDAIQLFEKYSPDLVFMDVHMPKLDGVKALIAIKKINLESKVIMVTSDTSIGLEKQLKECGANAMVCKPCDIQKIIKITNDIKNADKMLIQ